MRDPVVSGDVRRLGTWRCVRKREDSLGIQSYRLCGLSGTWRETILSIEEQTVAGASMEFFVIFFTKSKLTVRVPVRKAANVGMRKPSDLSFGPRSETNF